MISFRKNHLMLMINTVGVVLCTLSISFIVDSFGLVGALYALIISLSFIYIGLLVIIEKIVKKKGDFNGKNKKICF